MYLKSCLLMIALLVAGLQLGGCTQAGQWTLAYRDTATGSAWQYSEVAGFYQTLEQCQAKGDGLVRLGGDKGEYLCGSDCKAENGLLTCQITHAGKAGDVQ